MTSYNIFIPIHSYTRIYILIHSYTYSVDCAALIPKRHSAESLEMAEEPPIINIGAHISPDENVEEITDKSQNKPAYSKLDAHSMSPRCLIC